MKKIRSKINTTPHVLATCTVCGEQGGSSIDAYDARLWLFRHMRQNNHRNGTIEVGRISNYEMYDLPSNKEDV